MLIQFSLHTFLFVVKRFENFHHFKILWKSHNKLFKNITQSTVHQKKKNSFKLFKAFTKKKKKNTMYTFHHQFSTPTHSKMSKFLVSKCSQRLTVHIYKSFCATIYTPSNTTLSGWLDSIQSTLFKMLSVPRPVSFRLWD